MLSGSMFHFLRVYEDSFDSPPLLTRAAVRCQPTLFGAILALFAIVFRACQSALSRTADQTHKVMG